LKTNISETKKKKKQEKIKSNPPIETKNSSECIKGNFLVPQKYNRERVLFFGLTISLTSVMVTPGCKMPKDITETMFLNRATFNVELGGKKLRSK
jgi:hypothetical protein